MLDFTFRVDTTEGEREMRILADSLGPDAIDKALKSYAEKWLKPRIQSHFDTRPGWPPLAAATQERLRRTGGALTGSALERATSRMRVKLQRDLKRAKQRLGRVEDIDGHDRERRRQDFLAAQGKRSRSMTDVVQSRARAVERRELVLKEFERLAHGGTADAAHSLFGPKGEKALGKLQARMGRATAREAERKPLGKIAQSFVLKIKDGRLVYGSEIPWSGVHNEGGQAGKGARIPARPYAFLEPIDVEVLVASLLAHDLGVLVH